MPRKAAGAKRKTTRSSSKPRALAPARPSRKPVSARRAAKAVGTLARLGTAIAAEKIKQTVRRGRKLAARNPLAATVGKAALAAGVTAAVTVTAEEIARRGNR
jgi:hypothetical protein